MLENIREIGCIALILMVFFIGGSIYYQYQKAEKKYQEDEKYHSQGELTPREEFDLASEARRTGIPQKKKIGENIHIISPTGQKTLSVSQPPPEPPPQNQVNQPRYTQQTARQNVPAYTKESYREPTTMEMIYKILPWIAFIVAMICGTSIWVNYNKK